MEEQQIFDSTIYRVVHGSRAYGTHRPDSDRDEKGVCILSSPRYYYGTLDFQQKDSGWNDGNDRVIYDIRKFFKLALSCNPNIIEILFVDENDILQIDELGTLLRENREMFLSRLAAKTFTGYATSQLDRIRGHKSWIDNAPEKPIEADFWHLHTLNYGDDPFEREFEGHIINVHSPSGIDMPEGLQLALKKIYGDKQFKFEPPPVIIDHFDKAGFKAAKKKYGQYLDWQKNRNPDRAAIEAEHGFDRKHAYHLIRLLRMGKEIITEGKVLVRRPDAQELLDIRHGRKFTYDELVEYASQLRAEVDEAVKSSPLPPNPDYEQAEKLLLNLISLRLDK